MGIFQEYKGQTSPLRGTELWLDIYIAMRFTSTQTNMVPLTLVDTSCLVTICTMQTLPNLARQLYTCTTAGQISVHLD